MQRTILTLTALIALATGCAHLRPRGPEAVPFGTIVDPAVREGVLENGLTYFIRQNQEPRARAELRLVVNAGSILEDEDQRGLAHVVEHMAFNGTRSFAQHEIIDFLESIGMRFGPDINAYTSFDETVYTLTVPTDTTGVLERAIHILEEWAWQISFDSLQVEKERAVVIEEWRLGQGAGSRLQVQQFPTLAYRSRYAERLPIGTLASLRNFRHAALRRFYEDWYRPDLMAVVAVGDFDVDAVERLIHEHFGRIPARVTARPRRLFEVPSHQETLVSIATDPELTGSSVAVYVKRRPRIWRRAADHREWVSESLASAMLINRLSEVTQRLDAPLLDVSSYQGRFVRTLSTLGLAARVPNGRIEEGLQTLLLEIERAARHGFTRSELEREKLELMRAMEQRYAERHRTTSGSFAADYVSYYLYGGTVLGSEVEIGLYRDVVPRIALREVNARVRDWTQTYDRVVLVSAPAQRGVALPREEFLQAIVRLASRMNLAPYRDIVSGAPLVGARPSAGSIVAEEEIPELGIHIWQLSNGSRLILKPTSFREDEVLFAARSPGGTSLVEDADFVPAITSVAVVQAGGLGELSANDLRKRLTGTVAGVGADISELYEGLSGAASQGDLETLFQLVHLKFTAPREDSAAFFAYRSQARASLANRSANPEVAMQDTLRVVLSQNHPRARPPSTVMFDHLDMQRSFTIYRERFADAGDFTFFLVGTFELERVRPLVETYLASLPDTGRRDRPRDVGIRPPSGVIEKTVRRGLEPRSATQIVFTGSLDFTRENVVALSGLADYLRMRLREVLRENLGGTYGVDVRASANRDPVPLYQFSVAFGADPERVEELAQVVFDEIERLKLVPPSSSDMAKVREMQFRAREVDLRQNHYWLAQLISYLQNDWDLAEITGTANRLVELTPGEIQAAAGRYLDSSNYVRVTLVPEVAQSARGR